jgi:hypothetical protein
MNLRIAARSKDRHLDAANAEVLANFQIRRGLWSGSTASATALTSLTWNASSAAHPRSSPTGHAATRNQMETETREPKGELA